MMGWRAAEQKAERMPLPALGNVLAERFGRGVRYSTMLMAVYAGHVPAQQAANGRWSIDRADIDKIGRYFKLNSKEN